VEPISNECDGALQAFYSLPMMCGYPCKIQKKVKKNLIASASVFNTGEHLFTEVR
jgi:hypothetical protein